MIRITQLKMNPSQNLSDLEKMVRGMLRLRKDEPCSVEIIRQSVDARRKPDIYYVYTVHAALKDEKTERRVLKHIRVKNAEYVIDPVYPPVRKADASSTGAQRTEPGPSGRAQRNERRNRGSVVIIGTGPAGLFCGLLLARRGLAPVLIERGERASDRTRTVRKFWEGSASRPDPDSNVQFGEGGAGTFSDGKLNTGIKDPQGRIRYILKTFVDAGADPDILYSYKPHIGTDVLTSVVTHITDEICELGGEVRFGTKLDKLTQLSDGTWDLTLIRRNLSELPAARDAAGSDREACERMDKVSSEDSLLYHITADRVVLAIGHSARDTYYMLRDSGIVMMPKAFAVGLRIQHPQDMIDRAMYGKNCPYDMPPSPYKLTHRLDGGRGVYSFCMCPGGYVVNASSEKEMLAVNGMSLRGRESGNANSAIVVTVSPDEYSSCLKDPSAEDEITFSLKHGSSDDVLAGIEFQRKLEAASYRAGNGCIPVQTFGNYRLGQAGSIDSGFEPKIRGAYTSADLRHILPESVSAGIEEGILAWDRQISGFADPRALLAGVESRTSSPVRLERGPDCQAVSRPGLYPCGEGAGYAGGITSAAADGLRVAEAILSESEC